MNLDRHPSTAAVGGFFGFGSLVTRKLFLVVALFAGIILCLLVLDRFQAYVLDSVRAYVAGEGFWSKGQKDAVYHLVRFAASGDEAEYAKYEQGLNASLGDRQARMALQSDPPDLDAARQGFLLGRNHPDDVRNLISFFLYFSKVSEMKQAIDIWTDGDVLIGDLQQLGQQLYKTMRSGNADPARVRMILARVDSINEQVRDLEDRFSATLGNAARKITRLTGGVMFASTLLLLVVGIFLSRLIVRGMRTAQVALEESEARFRHVVESNMLGIMFWEDDGTISDANDAFLDIIGYSRDELAQGINWRAITPSEGWPQDERALDDIARQGYCRPYEKEYLHKDGHRVSVYLGAASYDGDSRGGGVCFALDISERKRAEQVQRLAAEVFNSASEAILVTDPTPAIKAVNPAFTRITGYQPEEVLGRNPNLLSAGRHAAAFYRSMWSSLQTAGSWKGEISNRRKNGEEYQEWLSISAIYDAHGEVTEYVGLFSDVSERRKLEEQLKQSQKMEAIGTLVGGIAHDFNNTLAAMQGNIYISKQYNRDNPQVGDKLDILDNLGGHSAEIVRQLLTFARKGIVQKTSMSLHALVRQLQALGPTIVPENIRFEVSICQDALMIHGDITQLQQVMLNLLNNARDAVERVEQPEILIQLDHYEPDAAFIALHADLPAGLLAHMTIRDNGCGIAEEDLEHIFEPFYTTKEVGKGSGLGMAMVYGSMQTHQGVVEVESRKGVGTTVHLYLPLIEHVEADAVEPEPAVLKVAGHRATVLVVDDNPGVRMVCSEILRGLGYTVVVEDDGAAAYARFTREWESIGLVVTDIVMPGMGGFAAVERMRALASDLPVIFMTGYDPDKTAVPAHLAENCAILTKPFTVEALADKVERLFGNAGKSV